MDLALVCQTLYHNNARTNLWRLTPRNSEELWAELCRPRLPFAFFARCRGLRQAALPSEGLLERSLEISGEESFRHLDLPC